jgi:hypothetical protein
MTARKPARKREAAGAAPEFTGVVEAFAQDQQVSYRTGQGFGYDALKINE